MATRAEEYTAEQRKADLKSMVETQSNFGSPHEYHRGMANGLILAYSIAYEPYGSPVKYLEEPKRDQAVACEIVGLKHQLASALAHNVKIDDQVIGLKQQIADLNTAVAKLKAIKKELRNIIELQREALL